MSALVLALLIPSLTFIEYIDPIATDFELLEPIRNFEINETYSQDVPTDYTSIILWSIYALGLCVFLLKFCLNLHKIISRIKNNPKYKSERFINVLVKNLVIPHTFFSYIFLNKNKFEHGGIPKEVILHEQTHAKQKHSIDVLVIELLQIIFWFNPLIYLLKRDIKLNHEFLADRAVLNNGIQPADYQTILLAFSSKASHQQLANAINYSSIKKRFTVMKTQTSKTTIWLRSLLLLPLIAILFYSFTNRKQIVKEDSTLIENEILNLSSKGVSEALMKEYTTFINEFNNTRQIDGSQYERMISIYNLMSEQQKKLVEPYPKALNIDLSKTKIKTPSKEQFESWKNEKEYAIWLDGAPILNAKLNDYTKADIAYFIGSLVHKNARSKNFPQPYQFNLYTKKGFEETYQESKVKKYKELTKTYSKAIQLFLKGDQLDNSELVILNEQCHRLYRSFTKEEIKQYNLLPAPPPPAQKASLQEATQIQVKEYNKLAKHYNNHPKDKRVVKLKDLQRLESIYSLMSYSQKKNAEPFPECYPPPPAPVSIEVKEIINVPPPPLPKNATLEQQKKYEKAVKNYKTKTHAEITRHKNKDGEIIEVVRAPDAIDIPPPPPPKSPLDHVIDMAKSNATFYYEGKKVSSDKAIELIKNNKSLNIQTKNTDTRTPKVYITKKPIVIKQSAGIKTGNIKVNGKHIFYSTKEGITSYFNRYGEPVDKNGTILNKVPETSPVFYYNGKQIPSHKANKLLNNNKSIAVTNKNDKNGRSSIFLTDINKSNYNPNNINHNVNHNPNSVIDLTDVISKGASFYFNDEKITTEKALWLTQNNQIVRVQTRENKDGKPLVYFSN